MRDRQKRWPLLMIAACLALAGCGGDDDGGGEAGASTDEAVAQAPQPGQDIEEFAGLLETALTTPDCKGLKTDVVKPKEGGIQLICPADDPEIKTAFADYKTTGFESYGTGAVIDYTAGEAPKGATWELSLGSDGTWVLDAGTITEQKTAGTELSDRSGFELALERFLPAVREGDCDAFFKYSVTTSSDKPTACKRELPFYANLAKALKADPEAKPVFFGGNSRYAFYGLETAEPRPAYRTVTVVKTAKGADEPYLVARTKLGPNP